MSSITLPTQRIDAGLSTRARTTSVVAATGAVQAVVGAHPGFAFATAVDGVDVAGNTNRTGLGSMGVDHANTAWLGGSAETGCATTAYGTKRITPGSLIEVMT